jgi:hypothetical protein
MDYMQAAIAAGQFARLLLDEVERLRYERRLLGVARMTLDLVAAGDQTRWERMRSEAGDVAQMIVDEIGHPVTDEPALGPSFRERITRMRELIDSYPPGSEFAESGAQELFRRVLDGPAEAVSDAQ